MDVRPFSADDDMEFAESSPYTVSPPSVLSVCITRWTRLDYAMRAQRDGALPWAATARVQSGPAGYKGTRVPPLPAGAVVPRSSRSDPWDFIPLRGPAHTTTFPT